MALMNIPALPDPSSVHATCAWCELRFPSIVALLDHVDQAHLDAGVIHLPRPSTPLQGLAA